MRYILLLFPLSLIANPQHLSVHAGQAQIAQQENILEVTTSDRAILNWNSFSIQAGETTRFIQPSSNSAVLNRVTGNSLSEIFGTLEANGRLFLVNPNGIVIGAEGQINAAAFLGTTAEIKGDDFLNQKEFHLTEEGGGKIINLGSIHTSNGPITLFAHRIENQGTLEAPQSIVSLAAAREVLLDPTGDSLIFIRHSLDGGGIDNQGTIRALETKLEADGPFSLAISCGGEIETTSIFKEEGRIFIRASDAPVEITGRFTAPEGMIEVEGGFLQVTHAHFDACGERGGIVSLLGSEIEVHSSSIKADGNSTAGYVRIGGDFQGKNRDILNSQKTIISEDVSILANSSAGEGGRVVVWSDGLTECHGSISAQGYTCGGYTEVSGAASLWMTGPVDLRSEKGSAGTLLLDPGSVLITTGVSTGPDTFGDSYIQSQLELGNVTIDTANATAGPQTISVDAVTISPMAGTNKLTLIAAESITFNGGGGLPVTISNTPLDMQAGTFIDLGTQSVFDFGSSSVPSTWTAGTSISVRTGFGAFYTHISWSGNAKFTMDAQSQILLTASLFLETTTINNTFNGTSFDAVDFTSHGAIAGTYSGLDFSNTSISTDSGNISLTGTGGNTGGGCSGIHMDHCPNITSNSGSIVLHGTSGGSGGNDNNHGVHIASYITNVSSLSSTVQITGESSTTAGASNNYGIFIDNSYVNAGTSATLNGTGGGTGSANDGIYIFCDGAASGSGSVSSGSGATLTGSTASGSGNGIHLDGGRVISSAGDLQFNGSSVSGNGILIETTNSLVQTTGTGSIFLDTSSSGVFIGYVSNDTGDATIQATGTGAISSTSAENIFINGGTTSSALVQITNPMSTANIDLTASRTIQTAQTSSGLTKVLNAGSGNITLLANGLFADSHNGVELFGGALTVDSGTLSITGNGGTGADVGVYITDININPSGTGNISLTGTGGSGGNNAYGIYISSLTSSTITTSSGTITMNGTGGSGGMTETGLYIVNSNISAGGNSSFTGTGGGTQQSTGLLIENSGGALIAATGSATLDFTGNGAPAGTGTGLYLAQGAISTVNGNLTLTGSEGGTLSGLYGVIVETLGTTVETTGTGSLSISSLTGDIVIGYNTIDTGAATVQTNTAAISLTSSGNILINGGTTSNAVVQISNMASSSNINMIAGESISLTSQGLGIPTISNTGTGNTYLVVDNDNPSSPGVGTSGITLSSNAILSNAGAELRLYTDDSGYNTFDAPINGIVYVPTAPQQVNGTYYPSGLYIGPGYTLYYKTGVSPIPPNPPTPPTNRTRSFFEVELQTAVIAATEPIRRVYEILQISLIQEEPDGSTLSPSSTYDNPELSPQAL